MGYFLSGMNKLLYNSLHIVTTKGSGGRIGLEKINGYQQSAGDEHSQHSCQEFGKSCSH
jgi:hypothetical protein